MLPRIAGRRLRHGTLLSHAHHTQQQLTLPWLCPTQLRSLSSQSSDSRRPPRRPSPSLSPRHESRSLATTADLQPAPSSSPFEGFMQAWGSRVPSPELSRIESWDPSSPLVLRESTTSSPQTFAKKLNFSGDAMELVQNLYACLRVGRMERASDILERLTQFFNPSAPELVDAHNIYFQTLLDHALQSSTSTPESMARLEAWYQKNMVQKNIEPSAQTFVTLLRASMNFLDDAAQDEAIRKYMAMAQEYGEDMVDDINCSPDFTDEEWDLLINAQPEEFDEPPSVQEMQEQLIHAPSARKNLVDHGLVPDFTQKIKPVQQKGLGLDSLKQALSIFEDAGRVEYPHDMPGTQEERDRAYAYARQIRLEQDALEAAVRRWKEEDQKLQDMGIHGVMNTKPIQAIMYNWYSALVPLFTKHINNAKEVVGNSTVESVKEAMHGYGAWLERCSPEKLAALTVSRAVSTAVQAREGLTAAYKLSALSIKIGTDVMDYLNADAQSRRTAFIRKQRQQMRQEVINKLHKTQQSNEASSNPAMPRIDQYEKTQIPLAVRVNIGVLALELLMQACTITITAADPKTGKQISSTQAAFRHNIGFQKGKKVGYIVPHHQLLEKLRNESVHHIQAVNLPMVVEPKPWSSFDDGGYYTVPQKVVRQKTGDPAQRAYAQSAIENGDMGKVLAGLDVLGKVPWQINTPILNIMAQAWNNGEGIAGLVPEDSGLKSPEEPPADATYQERAKWGKAVQEYENEKSGLHSQRCFQNFQLETARAFAKEKKIFFPHSVDFRGRAYPLPPVLNHIGADLARGLLKFANGKELGSVGLQWLKIHLANLYGFDKASLKDREQFATDHIDDIYDSATKPLDGRRWWVNAEDPWQCLACCMELKNALDSPDPTRYMSQLPVHQDGTCNGLQHYAALGGDHAGARQVNLEPSDRPQDIYTGVAELVKEMVSKDKAAGNRLATFIDGHITRKVVKRTVMTNVYGVTFIGAKTQVEGELRDIFPGFKGNDQVKSLASVALYIAYKIFEALGKIFNGAQEIQYWLGECGDRITTSLTPDQIRVILEQHEGNDVAYDPKYKTPKRLTKGIITKVTKQAESFRTSIIWTTPLKMPIVQPYRKDSTKKVMTKLQELTVLKRSSTDVVDKRKQLQAFPPNFIHSLDATHMILSALKCSEVGLDFAAVHDSFWTHAADIPNLNIILRDAFVRMHSEDIVQRLAQEFKARYAGHMYCANILANTEIAAKIRSWRLDYYTSTGRPIRTMAAAKRGLTTIEELALEAKRQKLLSSDDPEDVEKGKKMVTPTSIWLDNQDPKALSSARLSLLGETEKARTKSKEAPKKPSDEDLEDELSGEDGKPAPKELRTYQVWIPLTFPPVPKKGGWDVSRLRESKYFFS